MEREIDTFMRSGKQTPLYRNGEGIRHLYVGTERETDTFIQGRIGRPTPYREREKPLYSDEEGDTCIQRTEKDVIKQGYSPKSEKDTFM